MDMWKVNCKLFDKIVLESVFNLHCKCKRCNKTSCDGCEIYKQKIKRFGVDAEGEKQRSMCFQCINCNTGR